VLGARISLNGPNDRWTFSLFGDNLLNQYYSAGDLYQVLAGPLGLQNSLHTGSIAIRPLHGEPQTVGASFTVRY
jgi:iron complex outermembrane receptor protein